MNQLLNTGVNLWAYVPPVMLLIICIVGYRLAKTLYNLSNIYDKDEETAKQLTKSYIRQAVVIAICIAFAIFAGFFAYGPGKRISNANYKSGWMERTEKLPDEKPIEVIQQEGEAHKDRTGTLSDVASDKAFEKEGKDVDKEIDSILEKWDERNNNNK